MASSPRRSIAPAPLALLAHASGDVVAAYRLGSPITAAGFLADVERVAAALPESCHVLNFFGDRYRFAVLLCAAIVRGQVTLLPPTTTPNVIRAMREFAPDAYYVGDDEALAIDLPRCEPPPPCFMTASRFAVPRIAADQPVACVFTSGSTGAPQPHFNTWGSLVQDAAEECSRLGVGPGDTILGTVPPQHMYGFESTVLLPLLSGAALTAERPYYPADIDAAISRVPPRRVLFTTPFHLRAWLAQDEVAPLEMLVSATAPLPVALAREAEARAGATLLEIYGCTEAGQVASRRPTVSAEWHPLEPLRLWTEGDRTMVAGGHVEQATQLQDVIELLDGGRRFVLHGRLSDMVNIAGKRNSLGYLNHQLTTIPGVVDGVFLAPDEGDEGAGARLAAFVVAPSLSAVEVTAALRARIDAAFLPRPLVMVETLPRAATGKLPHEALRALASRHRRRTRSSR